MRDRKFLRLAESCRSRGVFITWHDMYSSYTPVIIISHHANHRHQSTVDIQSLIVSSDHSLRTVHHRQVYACLWQPDAHFTVFDLNGRQPLIRTLFSAFLGFFSLCLCILKNKSDSQSVTGSANSFSVFHLLQYQMDEWTPSAVDGNV